MLTSDNLEPLIELLVDIKHQNKEILKLLKQGKETVSDIKIDRLNIIPLSRREEEYPE